MKAYRMQVPEIAVGALSAGKRVYSNIFPIFFFLYGAASHIGTWPPLMSFLTLIDGF
jgi:hypothetical protein